MEPLAEVCECSDDDATLKHCLTQLDVENFLADAAKQRARVAELNQRAKVIETENEELSKIVQVSQSFKEILAKKYMEKQLYYIVNKTGCSPGKNDTKLSAWHIQYLRKNKKTLEVELDNRRNMKAKVQWLKSELQRRRENMNRVVQERKVKQTQLQKVVEALSEALPMVTHYRNIVEEQEQRISKLEKSLEDVLEEKGAWRNEPNPSGSAIKVDYSTQVAAVKEEIRETESRIDSLMESIKDLREEAESARKNVKRQRDLLEDIKDDLLAQDEQWKYRQEELMKTKSEKKAEVERITVELKNLQKKLCFMSDILEKSLEMFNTIKKSEDELFAGTGTSVNLNISASINNARKVANANPIMLDVREEQNRITDYLTLMIPRYEVQRATLHENRTAIREKISRVEVLRSRIAALRSYMKRDNREDINEILHLGDVEDTFCRSFEMSEMRIEKLEKTRAKQRHIVDQLRKIKTDCMIHFIQALREL